MVMGGSPTLQHENRLSSLPAARSDTSHGFAPSRPPSDGSTAVLVSWGAARHAGLRGHPHLHRGVARHLPSPVVTIYKVIRVAAKS